jgi:hypothetical protein
MKGTRALLLAFLAVLVAGICAGLLGEAVLRGWFCAFIYMSMLPVGALVLLLVNGITGGRWGEDLRPVLFPLAQSIPLLLAAFLPVLIFRSTVYDWAALGLQKDVTWLYLNPSFFAFRGIVGLLIWSALAWSAAWRKPATAAIGLVLHLIIMTFIPADWILTIPPGASLAAFGFGFGIEQVLAVLAFAALIAQQGDGRPSRDLCGMIISALLGVVYFLFTQYFITWFGNIPGKVHWYAARGSDAWALVMLLSFLTAAAIPFLAMLYPQVREKAGLMRVVGVSILLGIALHVAWMVLPIFAPGTILPALLFLLLFVLALFRLVRSGAWRRATA